jgi:hypothetical protein
MNNNKKRKGMSFIEFDLKFLNYVKQRLIYSIGYNDSFFVKIPVLMEIIQNTIYNSISLEENIIRNVYKELQVIVGKDFRRNEKKDDPCKIRHCITIITYEIYMKLFPEKLNISSNKMYELYPHFTKYNNEEQTKLFNFYKCLVILKDIVPFQRNFVFLFDLATVIVEGRGKLYARGGRANIPTRNRSKIVFDVYGEVKKPSMRFKKGIIIENPFLNESYDEGESNLSSNDDSYQNSSYEDSSNDYSSNDEESSSDEYKCLKKMRIDFTLFDYR